MLHMLFVFLSVSHPSVPPLASLSLPVRGRGRKGRWMDGVGDDVHIVCVLVGLHEVQIITDVVTVDIVIETCRHIGFGDFLLSLLSDPFTRQPPLCEPTAAAAQADDGSLRTLTLLYGCEYAAFLHLNRLGTNCEDLPQVVLESPAERDSTLPTY